MSQDKIYKKGGEIIEAKISEVGTGEIKYKIFKDIEGPVYTIEKDRIIKVVYQSGRTEVYQTGLKDPELYADQDKRALKINFLSPLRGYTQFNYEKNLRPGRSYEASLGIIGLGKRQQLFDYTADFTTSGKTIYREQAGAFIGGGYKFSKMPDYISGKDRYSHVMQGSYVKPELLFGVYGQNFEKPQSNGTGTTIEKSTVVFTALIINLGKQWVLGDKLLLDVYGGLGYALDNLKRIHYSNEGTDYYEDYAGDHFGVITAGSNSGIGFTGGLKIGILLK
ncbi:hypothetical protein WG906_11345 [Pedobacter sp. P351]|uniref:hypothetical protein n=1 Tax=Pedobacter superstes TaxID=3133441 RepID=UPI0030AAA7C3